MRLEISAFAAEQVRAIEAWWSVERPAAPDLFLQELAWCKDVLCRHPRLGRRFRSRRGLEMRRLLLRRTGVHAYYSIDEGQGLVTIQAVWHAARGRPPVLGS